MRAVALAAALAGGAAGVRRRRLPASRRGQGWPRVRCNSCLSTARGVAIFQHGVPRSAWSVLQERLTPGRSRVCCG